MYYFIGQNFDYTKYIYTRERKKNILLSRSTYIDFFSNRLESSSARINEYTPGVTVHGSFPRQH